MTGSFSSLELRTASVSLSTPSAYSAPPKPRAGELAVADEVDAADGKVLYRLGSGVGVGEA